MDITDKIEDKTGKIYESTLNVDLEVASICAALEKIFSEAEPINVLSPVKAYRTLRSLRQRLTASQPAFQRAMDDCLNKIKQPVEGGPSMDNAWFQGWSLALGLSSVTRLNLAFSNASSTIDRKTAYAMANFSLYIAIISFVVACIFGWLSLPGHLFSGPSEVLDLGV
jgi:hypothetical protein